ncbi:MAG: DUF3540 domain-containing protein [Desulfovibrionaceae bacterium]|nr:DUF3540 domain-containing protein [Desulfovibrionaceae bacterium]
MGYSLPLNCADNTLCSGVVQRADGDLVLVLGKGGLVRALRAQSCLLAPKVRDTVLLALLDDGSAWVLSILRSPLATDKGAELCLPKETSLHLGTLDIQADDARLVAKSIRLEGETVGIASRLVTIGGQILIQAFAVVRTLARSLGEQVARRFARYGALDETVDGLARRSAGRAQMEVEKSWRLRAENADMRAKKQVDIDASHIKVG